MTETVLGYILELRDGTKLRFDDGMEAYRHLQQLEPGSWSRLYCDIDRGTPSELRTKKTK